MTTTFKINTGALTQAAADINTNAGRIDQEVRAMRAKLASLQGEWTGSASAEFQRLMGEWEATHRKVTEVLTQISTAANRAASHYSSAEDSSRRLFTH